MARSTKIYQPRSHIIYFIVHRRRKTFLFNRESEWWKHLQSNPCPMLKLLIILLKQFVTGEKTIKQQTKQG